MSHIQSINTFVENNRWSIVGLLFTWVLGVMVYWSGLPPVENRPQFILGASVYIGLSLIFGWLVYRLMFKPLPQEQSVAKSDAFTVMVRRVVALGLLLATVVITVGGAWDEVWHRQYGVPFGEDLFWRPHLLMYFGFTIVMGLAGLAFLMIWKRGSGSMAQRLRAMPQVAWLVMMGALFSYVLPADPLWHIIYGEDISAWSLPHLALTAGAFTIALVAISWMLSTIAPRQWQARMRLTWVDLFVVTVVIAATSGGYQVLLTEWDALNDAGVEAFMTANNRPDWILPVLLIGIAGIVGGTVNHALRRWGAATLLGFLSLAIRIFLLQSFDYNGMTANAWIVSIPPLVALDLVYAWRLQGGKVPHVWEGAAAMTVGTLLAMVPLINMIYVYPSFGLANVWPIVVYGMLVGAPALWVGRMIGDYLGVENKQLEDSVEMPATIRIAIPAAFAATVAFIIFFVATASPPI